MKSRKIWIILILTVLAAGGVWVALKYKVTEPSGGNKRLWVSPAPGEKPLVGKWLGWFPDPSGQPTQLGVEIFEPLSDADRQKKTGRKRKKRSSADSDIAFDGTATIPHKLGLEHYDLDGAVEKPDSHQLHFEFIPEEGKRSPVNFTLQQASEGSWKGDDLSLTVTYTYRPSESATGGEGKTEGKAPVAEKKVTVLLNRTGP